MSEDSQAYFRFIHNVRRGTVLAFGLSGIAGALCAREKFAPGAVVFGIIALASLAVVVLLIAEQLVAAWIATRRGRLSVAGLLLLTAASGALFAVMRTSVALGLLLLALTLTIVSAAVEKKRQPKAGSSGEKRSASPGRATPHAR